MRLVLLIMTGLGFTLGLLCGLLLQLPADGLPANTDHGGDVIIMDNANTGEENVRWRRSYSDKTVLDGRGETTGAMSAGRLNGGGSGGKPRFDSPANPRVGPKPLVSLYRGHRPDNGQSETQPLAAGQAAIHAEQISSSVKSEQGGNKREGLKGESSHPPHAPPPPARPVTSYTLRLKNAGGRFVVDSALKRDNDAGNAAENGGQPSNEGGSSRQTSKKQVGSQKGSGLSEMISKGVLWSRQLEDSCPRGLEPREVAAWRRKASGMQVIKMTEGCGRMQNRLLTLKDGSQACARYRLNTDQIQGEVYSYYLAQLLNITGHLPPAVMLPVDTLSHQWKSVHLEMSMAQWATHRMVVLTRWLDRLAPSHIPRELREDDRKLHPTVDILGGKTMPELCDLLQWSDLIVFDYLTANLDRMVNNMFNKQWNAEMMSNPAHNLEKTPSGNLVFLDNESGLFHGYRLLEKYHGYHESLLGSLCVFRESTARAVKMLHEQRSVGEDLYKLFVEGELHHRHLPVMPEKNVNVLQDRVDRVFEQISRCEEMYRSR